MNGFDDIENKIKGMKKETSAETDQRILEDTVSEYQRSSKVRQTVFYIGPVFKTVAAIVIIALIAGTAFLVFNKTKKQTPPIVEEIVETKEHIVQPQQKPQPQPIKSEKIQTAEEIKQKENMQKLKDDLTQIAALIQAEDVNTLLAVIENIEEPAQILAATYLSKAGDIETLEILNELLASTENNETKYVLKRAVETIKGRINQAQADINNVSNKPEYRFKAKGILSGFITDAKTGEPVSDVTVRINGGTETKTDSNGFYWFDKVDHEDNYKIAVHSKDYVGITDYDKMPILNLSNEEQIVKHFQLHQACIIDVKVIDEQGRPVEKARLWATSLADERRREIGDSFYQNSTDANGLITLGGFEPSDTHYLITATHSIITSWTKDERGMRYRKTEQDYAPGYLKVRLTDPEIIEYGEIVLKKGIDVKGYAEYSDGVPAEGLKISARPDWWHSNYSPRGYEIDPNGNFTLKHIVPGYYSLNVSIPRGGGSSTSIPLYQTLLPPENNDLLMVTIPQNSPQSLVSISGKIIFVDNKKPRYVRIYAWSRNCSSSTSLGHGPEGVVDSNFTIERLEPGKYRLQFTGENIEQKVIENVEAPTECLEVELFYSTKPKLLGRVIDANNGKAITNFKVRARKLRTLRGANYVQQDRWTHFEDTKGNFQLEAVGPGVYQVQISADGYAPIWSDEINTDIGNEPVVKLTKGGKIKGRVINEKGKPVKGAKVIPFSKAGGIMSRVKDVFVTEAGAVLTDPKGQFILNNIPEGKEILKVEHKDYAFTIENNIIVENGQTTEDIEIILSKGGAVEGYVYDEKGKPQSNVTLYFQDDSRHGLIDDDAGLLATVITDANGYYHVKGLPEKICYINKQRQWESLGVVRRTVIPQNGKIFRIDLGGEPIIKGTLVIDNEPVANSKLLLSGLDNPNSDIFKCNTITDNYGNFTFRAGFRGKYAIYYKKTRRSNWLKIATVDILDNNIDLGIVPRQLCQLNVNILMKTKDPNITIDRLHLQQGTDSWGQNSGDIEEPKDITEPYIISGVNPGTYTIVATTSNSKIIRQTIGIFDDIQDVNLIVPLGTSSISGKILGSDMGYQFLWKADKTFSAYIRPDVNKMYEVNNLPAGKYFVGGNMMMEEGAIAEFELGKVENKVIDIDTSKKHKINKGLIIIVPVDDNGVIIADADVWLSKPSEKVESITNQRGKYHFHEEPGKYEANIEYNGYRKKNKKVIIDPAPEDLSSYEHKIEIIRLEKE